MSISIPNSYVLWIWETAFKHSHTHTVYRCIGFVFQTNTWNVVIKMAQWTFTNNLLFSLWYFRFIVCELCTVSFSGEWEGKKMDILEEQANCEACVEHCEKIVIWIWAMFNNYYYFMDCLKVWERSRKKNCVALFVLFINIQIDFSLNVKIVSHLKTLDEINWKWNSMVWINIITCIEIYMNFVCIWTEECRVMDR